MDNTKSNIGDKQFIENIAIQNARTTDDFLVKRYNKKQVQSFFGKLGNSLGMVVTVLPFAGLLLAIGGILISKAAVTDPVTGLVHANEAEMTAGLILSDLGNAAYGNLGLFFMLAIVMGFTGSRGMAVYSTLIGYIAFVGFITPFIRYEPTNIMDTLGNIIGQSHDPASAKYFHIWFWQNIGGTGHGLDVVTQLDNVLGLKQPAYTPETLTAIQGTTFGRMSYQGVKTLNTGVLGGIALGFVYQWEFNKTKDLKLPSILSFFEGEKFTSVIMLLTAPIVASLFIIIWPAVNYALAYIGIGLNYIPYGINSFLYGIVFQILLPFQAHMAFISPLWWTSAGGNLGDATTQQHIVEAMMYRISTGDSLNLHHIGQEASFYKDYIQVWMSGVKVNGNSLDTFLQGWLHGEKFDGASMFDALAKAHITGNFNLSAMQQSLIDYGNINWNGTVGDQLISVELLTKNPGFDMNDAWAVNIKATKYITTGFANDLFMLPAAGFGMWLTLPEDRRKEKFGLYLGAILSSIFFGVSEPIIFMFAFMCPLIYFLFYCPLFGLLAWLSVFLQSKVGSTFSQGLMDYIINGILPTATKTGNDAAMQTQLWWPIAIGAISFVPSMYGFKWMFEKVEFAVPGSYAAEEGIGTSESRYSSIKPSYDEALDFFGGLGNVEDWKLMTNKKALIIVKRADRVLQANEFSDRNIANMYVDGNTFKVNFKNRAGVNIDYVSMIARMVDLRNREKTWKFVVQQQRANFKEQMYGKGAIQDAKDLAAKKIKTYDKDYEAKIEAIKKADKGFKAYIKTKKADPKFNNAEAIASHNKDVKAQLTELKQQRKAFVKSVMDKRNAAIKAIKDSKKTIDVKAQKAQFKKDMKLLQLTKDKMEAINNVRAKWLFEQHKIEETSDIDKLKLQHQVDVWAMKHLQEKELEKIAYKTDLQLLKAGFTLDDEPTAIGEANNTADQIKLLKENYTKQMEALDKVDKEAIKSKNVAFKQQIQDIENKKKKLFEKVENK